MRKKASALVDRGRDGRDRPASRDPPALAGRAASSVVVAPPYGEAAFVAAWPLDPGSGGGRSEGTSKERGGGVQVNLPYSIAKL